MWKLLTVERGNCAKENVYTSLEFFTYFTVRTTFTHVPAKVCIIYHVVVHIATSFFLKIWSVPNLPQIYVWFMSFEQIVECQMFAIDLFFNCGWVLPFGAHSRYYEGALIQKRSFLVILTTFRSEFCVFWKKPKRTSNTKFVIRWSKWHEPDISTQ